MTTQPNKEQILQIAEKHIVRFTRWLEAPSQGVRVEECKTYLKLWQNVKAKGGENLSKAEISELQDALDSGDYDDLIFPGSTYVQRRCAAEDVPFLTERDV